MDWSYAVGRHNALLAPVATGLLVILALTACGGDETSVPQATSPSQPAAASPEQYVDRVCSAAGRMFAAYQKSFKDNLASLTGMDPTDAYAKTARQPFAVLISDLEQISPPTDAASQHADTIKQAKEVLAALNSGDRQKLLALRGTPDTGKWKQVIDLHADLKLRFGSASLQVKSCQELDQNGGGNPFQ